MSAREATGTGATGCYHLQNVLLAAIYLTESDTNTITQHYTQKPQMASTVS